MKKILASIVLMFAFVIAAPAFAEEVMTFKAESVTVAKTKTGDEYVRIITAEPKESNGIKYMKTQTVMAFRDMVAPAKQIKAGDSFTAIVQGREYQGRTSYTLLGIKQGAAVAAAKKQ